MKNKIFKIIAFLFLFSVLEDANAFNQFNFDVTEIQVTEKGNKIVGNKRGTITSDNGLKIQADKFEYNKNLNFLSATGNIIIEDTIKNYTIVTDNIKYLKNEDKILTKGNSVAKIKNESIKISANKFEYDRLNNILIALDKVEIHDNFQDYKIYSEYISYSIDKEIINSQGKTSAFIFSKYEFKSSDVEFLRKSLELSSKKDTTILDKFNLYNLSKFKYSIKDEELRGEEILVKTNYNLPKSDEFYFANAIINLKNYSFIAGETEIKIHKNIFSNKENDPRILGVSSKSNENKTLINKGVFTSCKKNDNCPPWSISANKIEHIKSKKQINYNQAVLKIYDKPVLYFPKFFHPDPTVIRQSGLLKPSLNNSSILGSSVTIPYFIALNENKDFTFKPSLFDSNIQMIQNEFRQKNNKSEFIVDFGFVKGFKSSVSNTKKNLNHLFTKFILDLDLKDFISSEMEFSIQKTNNDSYLKIFDNYITNSRVRPEDFTTLKNEIKISLNHNDYNFTTGVESYENLQEGNKSDKYQYILPYYNFDKVLSGNFLKGSLTFTSNGRNDLNNTNQLKSNVINDISYRSQNFINNNGIVNSLNVDLKNLNSLGKNYSEYKSSPQMEVTGILSLDTSLPLVKNEKNYKSYLTPKISLRFNPNDMKNNSSANKKIDVGNIFNLNRLGFTDTFESGKSLTLGLDYKKEKSNELNEINKYFEFKLATVIRDKEENFIPTISTLNKKSSNLFGSLENKFSDQFKIGYNFALDNDYNTFEYNNLNATLLFNKLKTEFNFIKENGEMGDSNVLENSTKYIFNNNNSITFKTRRNRKISLTEYYDLVYEYKNDCLTAGIKYKKTYYEDRDIKPLEDLLFTITLFPLTSYEYSSN